MTMPIPSISLTQRLLAYRAQYGLGQDQLAGLAGVWLKTVQRAEKGDPVPDSVVHLERVLAAPPRRPRDSNVVAGIATEESGLERVRDMLVTQQEVYQDIKVLPNGSRIFVVACTEVREVVNADRMLDVAESLYTNDETEWYFIYPDQTRLAAGAHILPTIKHGVEEVAKTKERILSKLRHEAGAAPDDDLRKHFQDLESAVDARLECESASSPTPYYFHPIVKSILVVRPADAPSPQGLRAHGWLEIPFYGINELPVLIRMSITEVQDLTTWLQECDKPAYPKRVR